MKREVGVRIDDETWVPIKWIYALVASCVVSLSCIVGAVWYVAAFAFKADAADAKILEVSKRLEQSEVNREQWTQYLIKIDNRLSRIEGRLKIQGDKDD